MELQAAWFFAVKDRLFSLYIYRCTGLTDFESGCCMLACADLLTSENSYNSPADIQTLEEKVSLRTKNTDKTNRRGSIT